MFVLLIRTGRQGVLHRLETRQDEAKLRGLLDVHTFFRRPMNFFKYSYCRDEGRVVHFYQLQTFLDDEDEEQRRIAVQTKTVGFCRILLRQRWEMV